MSVSEPKATNPNAKSGLRLLLQEQLQIPLSASDEEADRLLLVKLDSLSTMSLLLSIENYFQVEIDLSSLDPESSLSSLDALFSLVHGSSSVND